MTTEFVRQRPLETKPRWGPPAEGSGSERGPVARVRPDEGLLLQLKQTGVSFGLRNGVVGRTSECSSRRLLSLVVGMGQRNTVC